MSVEYRSLQEVADELGVHIQTVRRWIHTGRIRAFKPGKEYRIRQDDLDAFLAAGEINPKGEPRLHEAATRRDESAFVIVGRVIDGQTIMTVLWKVPPEERGKYRDTLHAILPKGFMEDELTPERARELVGAA